MQTRKITPIRIFTLLYQSPRQNNFEDCPLSVRTFQTTATDLVGYLDCVGEEISIDGMKFTIITEDVLIIPETVEEDGTTYVYTSYDENTDTLGDKVEVSVGISDGTYVEITSGLEEGDTYCYSVLDVVNYSSSYATSGSGSFSAESLFGNGGGMGGF